MQLGDVTAPADANAPTATEVVRVLVLIPKHAVELADPRAQLDDAGARKADGKSAAASIEIHFVRGDGTNPTGQDNVVDPTVYSIRRAADPLLPVKDATVDVIILLSEKPKEFKKGNVMSQTRHTSILSL